MIIWEYVLSVKQILVLMNFLSVSISIKILFVYKFKLINVLNVEVDISCGH
jgi:hypothetical protein